MPKEWINQRKILKNNIEEDIYNYLLEAMYSLPSCNTCQYNHTSHLKRVPCSKCEGWNKYKLHKGHKADLERMVRGIIKIVKTKGIIVIPKKN